MIPAKNLPKLYEKLPFEDQPYVTELFAAEIKEGITNIKYLEENHELNQWLHEYPPEPFIEAQVSMTSEREWFISLSGDDHGIVLSELQLRIMRSAPACMTPFAPEHYRHARDGTLMVLQVTEEESGRSRAVQKYLTAAGNVRGVGKKDSKKYRWEGHFKRGDGGDWVSCSEAESAAWVKQWLESKQSQA